jgi:hypothetical protein
VKQNVEHVACLRQRDVVGRFRDWLPYMVCHLSHEGSVDAEFADTGAVVGGAVVAVVKAAIVENVAVDAGAVEAGDEAAGHCE